MTDVPDGATNATVTITWKPVAAETQELDLEASNGALSGPSPLVLTVELGRGKFMVDVAGIEEGPVVNLPRQPFHAHVLFS